MTEYYKAGFGRLECIDVIQTYGLRYERGCMLKYLMRAGKKPNTPAALDYGKAEHYAQLEEKRKLDKTARVRPTLADIGAQWDMSHVQLAGVALILEPTTDPLALQSIFAELRDRGV